MWMFLERARRGSLMNREGGEISGLASCDFLKVLQSAEIGKTARLDSVDSDVKSDLPIGLMKQILFWLRSYHMNIRYVTIIACQMLLKRPRHANASVHIIHTKFFRLMQNPTSLTLLCIKYPGYQINQLVVNQPTMQRTRQPSFPINHARRLTSTTLNTL